MEKRRKYRQIKTVATFLDRASRTDRHDREVNELLLDGWYLVKRYTVAPGEAAVLITELERYEEICGWDEGDE